MRQEHLKEAEQIVSSLAWYANARKLRCDVMAGFGALRLAPPGYDRSRHSATEMPLTKSAAEAALTAIRREWDAKEAELRRRAAQIGLILATGEQNNG